MREIIFRGKTVQGEWVYGTYFSGEKWSLIIVRLRATDFVNIYSTCEAVEVIPETVGQFTGLRIHGIEIYKDDICKITQGCGEVEIGVVVWDERSLCWALDVGSDLWHFSEIIECEHLVEVIGNIHDDSTLLKEVSP